MQGRVPLYPPSKRSKRPFHFMQPCPITPHIIHSPHYPLIIISFQTATCPVGTSAVWAQSCTPLPQRECIGCIGSLDALDPIKCIHTISIRAQTPSHPPPMQRSHHDFTNRSPAEIDFGTYLSTLVLASLDFLYVVDQTNRAHLTSRVLLDIAYKLLL